jgi:hypothetical protein
MRESLYAPVLQNVGAALNETRHLARVRTRLVMAEGGKAATETDSGPGSRDCLDFIAGFLCDAVQQAYPMRT